ncbi:unnamed protein product [Nezara viridula]|uniref:Nudix hydrolase domain-containing protein n=1 Tax=Nezara viridula TaxID=85310 RepID=A0A9P0E9H9_NEZVI|nr:unnamed protein product [Nezara viridula]
MAVFQGTLDQHNGITVESVSNACNDIQDFAVKLEASLLQWEKERLRGVWFNVDISQIEWIPILSQKGFNIHHAKDNKVSLYLWLPKLESCKIPPYAHNMVGAGALVINDNNQILVVHERYRTVSFWKLPGGYVDPGEEIGEAAQREVLEETGIKTEFLSLLSVRHLPSAVFGCSDLYFVVRLKPLSYEITKQDDEVEDCQWMDINTFLSHPQVIDHVRNFVKQAILNEKEGIAMIRNKSEHPLTKKPQYIFTVHRVKDD